MTTETFMRNADDVIAFCKTKQQEAQTVINGIERLRSYRLMDNETYSRCRDHYHEILCTWHDRANACKAARDHYSLTAARDEMGEDEFAMIGVVIPEITPEIREMVIEAYGYWLAE